MFAMFPRDLEMFPGETLPLRHKASVSRCEPQPSMGSCKWLDDWITGIRTLAVFFAGPARCLGARSLRGTGSLTCTLCEAEKLRAGAPCVCKMYSLYTTKTSEAFAANGRSWSLYKQPQRCRTCPRKKCELDLDQMVPRLLSLAPLEPPQAPIRIAFALPQSAHATSDLLEAERSPSPHRCVDLVVVILLPNIVRPRFEKVAGRVDRGNLYLSRNYLQHL